MYTKVYVLELGVDAGWQTMDLKMDMVYQNKFVQKPVHFF